MSFHVGQKVECIDDRSNYWSEQWVTRGKIYIVATVDVQPRRSNEMFESIPYRVLELVGINKPHGFASIRFRPIVEDRKSISFTMGADPESERWDNRVKIPAKA